MPFRNYQPKLTSQDGPGTGTRHHHMMAKQPSQWSSQPNRWGPFPESRFENSKIGYQLDRRPWHSKGLGPIGLFSFHQASICMVLCCCFNAASPCSLYDDRWLNSSKRESTRIASLTASKDGQGLVLGFTAAQEDEHERRMEAIDLSGPHHRGSNHGPGWGSPSTTVDRRGLELDPQWQLAPLRAPFFPVS